MFSISRNS